MIAENRDPTFWTRIASHPACAGALHGFAAEGVGQLAQGESAVPLASENGGFLFLALDALKTTYELHTLFTPEGWGREVNRSAKEALQAFDWRAILTFETADRQTQPPRSFGFVSLGPKSSPIGDLTVWLLTRPAWEASKAFARLTCQ